MCVGIDPVAERLPKDVAGADAIERVRAWSLAIAEAVAPHVPAVKIQSACFERFGWKGVRVCEEVVTRSKELGLVVILDAKRGDIGASSEHYAAGQLAGDRNADALTVNSYLGVDGIEPFIAAAARDRKGLFALVRTSNPGGDALQGLALEDGRSVSDAVAQLVAGAGAAHVGSEGYSLLGAVVGATKAADAVRLRELMPQQIFLVPGFGAQGGKADDVRACFRAGKLGRSGAIITASRSVIFAHEKRAGVDWRTAVVDAAKQMKDEVNAILA